MVLQLSNFKKEGQGVETPITLVYDSAVYWPIDHQPFWNSLWEVGVRLDDTVTRRP